MCYVQLVNLNFSLSEQLRELSSWLLALVMRRRSLGSKPHPGRRRGEQSFKHSPRQDFSPRPYGRGEANQRSNYSPGRQSHHHDQHQQYNSSSAHYVSDLRDRDAAATRNSLSRVHTSLDADSTSFMDQSSSIPQLSSNRIF